MTPPAPKASGRPRLARFVSLAFLMLVGFALPQQAAAETVSIANASVAENGGKAEFTVSLTTPVESDVVLAVAYAAGTATLATDLGTLPTTVMIEEGETSATLMVPITNDAIVEGDEDFTVTISEGSTPLPEGVTIGTDNTATGTITEDDAAEVTLGPPTLAATENGTFPYTVSLSAAADEAVTVRWTATDGTATVTDDLQAITGTVTFNANTNSNQIFTIRLIDDAADEGNETFTVTLGPDTEGNNPLPTGVTIGTDNSSTATITDNDGAPATLATASIGDIGDVSEGAGNAEFTVSLDQAVTSDVILNLTYLPSGGLGSRVAPVDDLGSDRPTTVTIPADETQATFIVPIADDDIVEFSESFFVEISASTPPNIEIELSNNRHRGRSTITDNDTAEFSLAVDRTSAAEGVDFTFTVSLSGQVSRPMLLDWNATETGDNPATLGINGSDLEAPQIDRGDLTFDALTTTSQQFTIRVLDDGNPEPDETFTVTLSNPRDSFFRDQTPPGLTVGSTASQTVTITNNDGEQDLGPAEVSLRVQPEYTFPDTEDGEGLFVLNVDKEGNVSGLLEEVTFTYSTTNGTATAGTDYTAQTNQTRTILGSTTGSALPFVALGDNIVEEDETFTVTFTSDTEFVDGNNTTTVTIVDQDVALVSLEGNANAREDADNITFTVKLLEGDDDSQGGLVSVAEDVAVTWTATAESGDTATVNADLDSTTGTATIRAGNNEATFTVPITDDPLVEGDETFTVTLSAPVVSGNIDADRVRLSPTAITATGTITEDDEAEVTLGPAMATAVEGGTFSYTVSLSAAADEAVTVRWTATAGPGDTASLTDDVDTPRTGTVTFDADTNANQTFTIATIEDTAIEGDETFTVTLGPDTQGSNPLPTGVTIGTSNSSTATITDNDTAIVDLRAVREVSEDANNLTFRVNLDRVLREDVTLSWAVTGGTASAADFDEDYKATGTVTIPSGQGGAPIQFVPIIDSVMEGDETLELTISSPPSGVQIGTATATATIAENETTTVDLRAVREVSEDANNLTFRVNLDRVLKEDVTVSWAVTGGTASAADFDEDYKASGTVTIPSGQDRARIRLGLVDDEDVEGPETLVLTISSPPSGVQIGTATATGTITDNDTAAVNLVSVWRGTEGARQLIFGVILDRVLREDVTLSWAVTGGTASAADFDEDYEATGTVTIPSGQDRARIRLGLVDDEDVEGPETLVLTISSPPSGVQIGTATATGTITDNDTAAVNLVSVWRGTEGVQQLIFGVILDRVLREDVTLSWAVTGGTASAADFDEDYEATGTVTIPSGQDRARFIRFWPVDDDDVEGPETLELTISSPPSGVQIGTATATGMITDDYNTPSVSLVSVREVSEDANNLAFRVYLSQLQTEDVTVSWAVTGGTASAADFDDSYEASGTVTIEADRRSAPIRFRPVDDDDVEGPETLVLTISSPPSGVQIGAATATGTITDDAKAPVVSLLATTYADEGVHRPTFQVRLDRRLTQDVTVSWAVTGGTASAADFDKDYEATGTVTIPSGQRSVWFELGRLIIDSVIEGDETLELTISNPSSGVQIGLATITTLVYDNTGIVDLRAVREVSEGDPQLTFRVMLNRWLRQDVTLSWAVTGGTASAADFDDSYEATGTVTIPSGQESARIRFRPVDDDDVEGPETFVLTISSPPSGVGIGTATATATITDDDATVSIDDASVVEKGGNAEFTVSLTTAVESDVTLAVAYAAGTATLAEDLGTLPTTVTIEEGETSATLLVPITDDAIFEGNEDFTVTISEGSTPLPEGVTIGTDNEATGTITEDDAVEVTLGPAMLTAVEGGTFTYTVSLSAAADEAVTVRWTATDGTATVDDDLKAPRTGTVTFDTGQKTFTIATIEDTAIEGDETFTVTLGPDTQGSNPLPTGVTIGTSNSSTATITDNDTAIVDLRAVREVSEDANNLTFRVNLDRVLREDVTLSWAVTGGTASAADFDEDYEATGTVTIPSGQDRARIRFPLVDDVEVEETETLVLTISSPPSGVQIGTATATGTIIDNTPTVNLWAVREVSEDANNLTFQVYLSQLQTEDVTVSWAVTGGTASAADFDDSYEASGTVTIEADRWWSAPIRFRPVDDGDVEGPETLVLTISSPPSGVQIGTATATGTIIDNTPTVNLWAVREVSEDANNLTFQVYLSQLQTEDVTVSWAVTGGTASAADFDDSYEASGTVTIEADRWWSAPIRFRPVDDGDVEGPETLVLTISSPPSGVQIGTATATGTIIDNTPTVNLWAWRAVVSEDATNDLLFGVSLDRRFTQDVTLSWAVTGGTASAADFDDDYEASGTVTIEAGRGVAYFQFPLVDDVEVEGPETLVLTISSPPSGVQIGTATATATIADDDNASPTVDLRAFRVSEGSNDLFFRVDLNTDLTEDVTLSWAVTGGTASAADFDEDYEATGTVTIPSGQDSARIRFPLVDDVEVEETETLVLTISSPPSGVQIGLVTATGTITDDDDASPTVNLVSVQNATEGPDNLEFQVNLDRVLREDVTLSWAVTGGTASAADFDDSYEVSGTVTILNGQDRARIQFVPIIDSVMEGPETLILTISSPPSGVQIGTATATGTITDDDDASPTVDLVSVQNATEGPDNLEFQVNLDRVLREDVTLSWAVTGGTASAADFDDSYEVSGTVTILNGQDRARIQFVPIIDSVMEGPETLILTISSPPSGVQIGTATATGTITDDDDASPTVDLRTVREVSEDATNALLFDVILDRVLKEDVTLSWAVTGGTASAADFDDSYEVSGTVTILNGQDSARFRFRPVDDDDVEGPETLVLTISSPPSGVQIGTATATGTIIDDDATEVTVDAGAPTVVSIERVDSGGTALGELTNADSLRFRVTFSETVANVDEGDFGSGGDSTAEVASVTGSGATRTVTLGRGNLATFDGQVGLTFDSAQNIEDEAGNALVTTTPTGDNETYTVDNTGPTVVLARKDGLNTTLTGAFDVTVTFTEPNGLQTTGAGAFAVADLSVMDGTATSVTVTADPLVWTAVVTPTAGHTGNVLVDLPADGLEDVAGNGNSAATQLSVQVDTTAPSGPLWSATLTVADVSVGNTPHGRGYCPSGSCPVTGLTLGTKIEADSFTVPGTSDTVTVTAVVWDSWDPRDSDLSLRLFLDPLPAQSVYEAWTLTVHNTAVALSANDGVSTLTGDTATSIQFNNFFSSSAVMPANGDSITVSISVDEDDGGGGEPPDDTTAPMVTSIERVDSGGTALGAVTNADTVRFLVTFSETVANVDSGDFGASGTTATVTGVTGSEAIYTVTLGGGDLATFDGQVGLIFAAAQNIVDPADNRLVTTTPTGADETYTVDNTAPTVVLTRTDGLNITLTAAFDVTVTFTEINGLQTTGVGAFADTDLTVMNGTATVTATPGNPLVWTARVTPTANFTGNMEVDLPAGGVLDMAGNGNTAASQLSVQVGTPAPMGPLWSATLTVDGGTANEIGYCPSPCPAVSSTFGHPRLTDDSFTLPGTSTTVTVNGIVWSEASGNLDLRLFLDPVPTRSVYEAWTLTVHNTTVALSDNDGVSTLSDDDATSIQFDDFFENAAARPADGNSITVSISVGEDDGGGGEPDTTLSALSLAETDGTTVTLSPTFASGTTSYTASVANDVSSLTVAATETDTTNATVAITPADSDGSTSGHQVALSVGNTTVTATVSNGGATRTYTITIARAAAPVTTLSALSLAEAGGTEVTLTPTFQSGTTSYAASVASDVSSVTVTATATDDTDATVVLLPADSDGTTAGHQVALTAGGNTDVTATVSNGGATRTYTVTVTRAAATESLWSATLTVDEASYPSYAFGYCPTGSCPVTGLTLGTKIEADSFTVPGTSDTVTVTAMVWGVNNLDLRLFLDPLPAAYEAWTLTVHNTTVALSDNDGVSILTGDTATSIQFNNFFSSGALKPDRGDSITVVSISVGEGDGGGGGPDTTLSDLTVADADGTAVTLTPAFASATTEYAASVASDVAFVTVAATATDTTNAMVEITPEDSDTSTDGHQVPLDFGDTDVTATVTNGSATEDYAITITRAEGTFWSASLTMGQATGQRGYCPGASCPIGGTYDFGMLSDDEFTVPGAGTSVTVTTLVLDETGSGGDLHLILDPLPDPLPANYEAWTLTVDGTAIALSDNSRVAQQTGYRTVTIQFDDFFSGRTVPAENAVINVSLSGVAEESSGTGGSAIGTSAPAGFSVSDAEAHEDAGAQLAFNVTLDQRLEGEARVAVSTRDGSAKAGQDYEAVSDTLIFAPGETEKTVLVPVLDDSHDEGREEMTLVLSEPVGAVIADGEGTGVIVNSDAIPKAWIARFGRTVTSQVLDAVDARLSASRQTGWRATLAGQAMPSWNGEPGANLSPEESPRDWRDWLARLEAERDGAGLNRRRARGLTEQDLMTGTSFELTAEADPTDPGAHYSVWGGASVAGFDGREDGLNLDGRVMTGLVGADWTTDDWMAGLAVGHSMGTGGYRRGNCASGGCGSIEADLTGLYPYAGLDLSERITAWAAAGYGTGELTVTPDGAEAITTDLTMSMGAVGLRGEVLVPESAGGLSLAVTSEVRATRTSSEAVQGAGGNLAEADVWTGRLGLEGARRFRFGNEADGASLTPSFEMGLRLDGGDAERGLGADIGGGLALADPETGLSLDLKGRGLLIHEDAGFREWGASTALSWDPQPMTERGLSLSLDQSWGASPSGRVDALLRPDTFSGFASGSGAGGRGRFEASSRLDGEVGYGVPMFGDDFTGTFNAGFGLSPNDRRDYRFGWRLSRERPRQPDVELRFDANRREAANNDPRHGVAVLGTIRLRW